MSVEQLIVGVLLFTPLLGLFPTAAAWYLSVCCCHGALLLLRLVLLGLGRLLRLRALQLLLSRWSEPQQFPGQMMVQPLVFSTSSSTVHHASMAQRAAAGSSAAAAIGDASAAAAHAYSEQQQAAQLPAYYQLYCDPISYADVLKSFLAQQAAEGAPQRSSWGAHVLDVLRAVAKGEVWGVGLFCRS